MRFYQRLNDRIFLLEKHIKERKEKEQLSPLAFIYAPNLKPVHNFSFIDSWEHLKLSFFKSLSVFVQILLVVRGAPASNFNVFTQAGRDGVYICNYSYCHYKGFHKGTRWRSLTMVTAATIIVSLVVALVFPGKPVSRAATNTWNQASWVQGADTVNTANHSTDQTGWQKFYSKDANVIVGYGGDGGTVGEAKLAVTTISVTETTTANFAAGTQSNTGATNNSVLLLKPAGASCTIANECIVGSYCSSSICSVAVSFVTIGTQIWMASNVNIGTRIAGSASPTNNGVIEKYCYSDTEANCTTDGGLYQWNEAMGYAATCNGTGASQPACSTPVQGICPSGTHIPSHYEYTLLEKSVGSNPGAFLYDTTTVGWLGTNEGTNLKSIGSPYFYGILAGYRDTYGSFNARGTRAYFWTSTESGSSAWYRHLDSSNATVDRYTYDKANGYSVRCLKD